MSHLGRILRKQRRIVNSLKKSPIISLYGFGISNILVFQSYCCNRNEISREHSYLQNKINNEKYKDIKDFDSYHSSDIEFSHLYCGKHETKYQSKTKKQLIDLGQVWRERIDKEYPESSITIVVYFDHQNGAWFLDTYNWDIKAEWREVNDRPIWL
jgi:hypothetical protein